MTTYYGDNYTSQYITKPSEKIPSGEVAGRKRILFDKILLSAAVLNGEAIVLSGKLPKNARVISASLKVDKSLGATGIFSLGHQANDDEAADADAFVASCDAGGQAAIGVGGTEAGIHKSFSAETQVQVTCTEDMDGSVLTGTLSAVIEYVVD